MGFLQLSGHLNFTHLDAVHTELYGSHDSNMSYQRSEWVDGNK